jgi:glyoxylase-like metal-dependent hydrolase (beta-lactamase superfamily II)
MASEHEAEIISGKRRPDPSSNAIFRFVNRFQRLPTAPVGRVVCEGEIIAAGFRIVSTPGHTLGHTSLLRDEDDLLFTADAFGALPCRIRVGVQKAFCTDPSQARRSTERLLEEEFDIAIMSHSKPLRTGARRQLREAATSARAGCGLSGACSSSSCCTRSAWCSWGT